MLVDGVDHGVRDYVGAQAQVVAEDFDELSISFGDAGTCGSNTGGELNNVEALILGQSISEPRDALTQIVRFDPRAVGEQFVGGVVGLECLADLEHCCLLAVGVLWPVRAQPRSDFSTERMLLLFNICKGRVGEHGYVELAARTQALDDQVGVLVRHEFVGGVCSGRRRRKSAGFDDPFLLLCHNS